MSFCRYDSKHSVISVRYLTLRALKASEYVNALPRISNVLLSSPLLFLLFFLGTNCEVPDTADEAQSLEADCDKQNLHLIVDLHLRHASCQENVVICFHDGDNCEEYYARNHNTAAVNAATFSQRVHVFHCR